MSNEELFQQVQRLLERKLTPEERQFLVLASKKASGKKPSLQKEGHISVKIV